MPITTDINAQLEAQAAFDAKRNEHQLKVAAKNAKLEALRMAKELVMENHRSVMAGTAIAAGDITSMAAELEAFVNS